MAGLSLGMMGRTQVTGSTAGFSASAPSGGTATEMGFGPGYTQQGTGGSGLFSGKNPASVGVYSGVIAIVLLCLIRHSLPA